MKKFLILFIAVLLIVMGFIYFSDVFDSEEKVTEEPYITGEIHSIFRNRILIAEESRGRDYTGKIEDLEGNAIWITIEEGVEIMDSEGNDLQLEDLGIGLMVEVWTKGLILESYPAQGAGYRVILLEKEEIAKECFIGGCSGELCTNDPEAISTCEFLPGMECIGEGMSCELVNNECTWVLSQEAALCFMEIENEYGEQMRNTRIGYLFEKAEEKRGN